MTRSDDVMAAAHRLRELAQAGLGYSTDRYDQERFREITRIAHGLVAAAGGLDEEQVTRSFELERGYPTPKLDVRAAVLDGAGRLLLVRDARDGSWSLPGGWADIDSSPVESAEREVLEETGVTARCERLVALLDKRRGDGSHWAHHIYTAYFLCQYVDGVPVPDGVEVTDARFTSTDELPPLGVRSPRRHIDLVLARAADPHLAAAID